MQASDKTGQNIHTSDTYIQSVGKTKNLSTNGARADIDDYFVIANDSVDSAPETVSYNNYTREGVLVSDFRINLDELLSENAFKSLAFFIEIEEEKSLLHYLGHHIWWHISSGNMSLDEIRDLVHPNVLA
jgi:hypothetical protein